MMGNSSTQEDPERTLKQMHWLLFVLSTEVFQHHHLVDRCFINCNEVFSTKTGSHVMHL